MKQKSSQPDAEKLLQMLAGKTGRDPAQIRRELSGGDVSGVLSGMDAASRAQAEKVLSDPKLIRQMLESPQMKAFLKKLGG